MIHPPNFPPPTAPARTVNGRMATTPAAYAQAVTHHTPPRLVSVRTLRAVAGILLALATAVTVAIGGCSEVADASNTALAVEDAAAHARLFAASAQQH